jgi:hypothetical protein
MFKNFAQHLAEYPPLMRDNIIFYARTGSRAYGLERPDSDHDFKGIYAPPFRELSKLKSPPSSLRVGDVKTHDGTCFELREALGQLAGGSASMMEAVWSEDIVRCTNAGQHLLANRGLFLTKAAVQSHLRWGAKQIIEGLAEKISTKTFGGSIDKEFIPDTKRILQGFRLALVAGDIMNEGHILVRLSEERKTCLREWIAGTPQDIEERADKLFAAAHEKLQVSALPDRTDPAKVDQLFLELRSMTAFK